MTEPSEIKQKIPKFIINPDENSSNASTSNETLYQNSRFYCFFSCFCRCFYTRRARTSEQIALLPPEQTSKKTLVLDLDETLVHSSLEPLESYDLKITIEVDNAKVDICILVRPWAMEFIEKVAELYEVVIFTASLKAYADPVIEHIDRSKVVKARLFRTECLNDNGTYIKNLARLGRDLKKVVIVDNSPISYSMHPFNAVGISSWFDDASDRKLLEVYQILETLSRVDDIPLVLKGIGKSKLELSPRNIQFVLSYFVNGRSELNSPRPNTEEIKLKEIGDY